MDTDTREDSEDDDPENAADQERMNFGHPKCTQAVQQGDESNNDEEREAQDSEDMFSDA